MRAFVVHIVVSAFIFSYASGQTQIVLDGSKHIDTAMRPLVLVDTFKTEINYLVLNPQKIVSIDVLKDSAAISQFGEAGKFGVIFIHPKAGTKFLQIDRILDDYNFTNEDKKLNIYLNKVLMQKPKLLLIEQSEFEDVEVIRDNTISRDRFINIRTRTINKDGL
jgi:hypothetical protein